MGGTLETRYARDGNRYLTYQVVGEKGPDVLFMPTAMPPSVLGSGLDFRGRGERELKDVPGPWRVLSVGDS
jgi:hypothetical protein